MTGDILAVDIGTSALKLGVFSQDLERRAEARRTYEFQLYDHGRADIDPELWWQALRASCQEVAHNLRNVGVVTLSVTTPGLTAMAADGAALAPAVLFLDGRSRAQALSIRQIVGDDRFLSETLNLPMSGGSSLATILWIRDSDPDLWARTAMFGHCNTYVSHRMTGAWAIDPSTTSITGMYNTARNDLTWNLGILDLARIPVERLPAPMQAYDPVGRILPGVADELGLPADCVVLCGGNDATLAALSGGLTEPGDIGIASGTCDIAMVCTDRPISSPNFNVRCHAIPDRWLTFFVLNTGGEAIEWFRGVFCRELDAAGFYDEYLPTVLNDFLGAPDVDLRELELPVYVPYLSGSRYSPTRLKAGFGELALQTSREDLLVSLIRGNMTYLGGHLAEIEAQVNLGRRVGLSGGVSSIPGMLAARRRWTGDFDYVLQDQSSMRGAAMLGQIYLSRQNAGVQTIGPARS